MRRRGATAKPGFPPNPPNDVAGKRGGGRRRSEKRKAQSVKLNWKVQRWGVRRRWTSDEAVLTIPKAFGFEAATRMGMSFEAGKEMRN